MARKRKPYLAIELEVFDDVPAMAQAAGMTENDFGWPLLKLWRRCWQQKVAVVSPLVIEGFLPGALPTLIAFDFAQPEGDAGMVKLRGLDRYLRIKAAQTAAAKETNQRNAERALSAPDDPDGAQEPPGSGAVSAPESGAASVGKIEDRRSKIDQTDLPIGLPKKPAKAPRKPSAWEAIWTEMQGARGRRLEALGKDPTPEAVGSALVNTLLAKVDAQLRELAGEAYLSAAADIPAVFDHFLLNTWAEGLSPPFPIQAFANPGQLSKAREKYAEAVRLELQAEERA